MNYIGNFSGGLCSFFAMLRIVKEHGPLNCVLLFADTLIESKGLYEFNLRASEHLGIPLTRVSKEETPWELFRREGMIANNRFPICSIRLKREPLNEWMEANFEMDMNQSNFLMGPATVVLGFDWTEQNRLREFQEAHPSWRACAPMTEEPIWDKCKMQAEAEKLGLPISDNYKWGLPHDNCGGRCVRAGMAHWARLLVVNPCAYTEWEDEEIFTQSELARRGISNAQFTILKDRRNGETKPLTLRDFRKRVENGESFDREDWGGCGCGGDSPSVKREANSVPSA